MLAIDGTVTVITWLPSLILYGAFDIMGAGSHLDSDLNHYIYLMVFTLAYVDTFSTPVIYFATNSDYRVSLRQN